MTTSTDREIEQIRSLYNLRELAEEEEGTGIDRLPGGVYGYTYSPASENFPLFREKKTRCYEAHKRKDGSAHLVGYLTRDEVEQIKSRRGSVVVHLFPEAQGKADQLALVPMGRVASHREHSQRGNQGLELTITP